MNTTDRNDKIARRIELESRPAPTTQAEALMDLSDVRELYLDRGGFPAEGDRIRDLVDGLRNRGWSAGPVADALREIAKTVNVTWYTASRRIELAADAIEH